MAIKSTLCYIIQDKQVLLIKKKRGPGKGMWNGPGGKIEDDETILQGTVRELQEETGITPINPKIIGFNKFSFDDKPFMDVFVVIANDFEGKLQETDEANPQWFDIANLPWKNMWCDDPYWMHLMFNNRKFVGIYDINKKKNKLNYHKITVLD